MDQRPIKLLEENTGAGLYDLECSSGFLDRHGKQESGKKKR